MSGDHPHAGESHDHSHGSGGHDHGAGGHDHGAGGHDHGPGGHDHGPGGHDHGPGGHEHSTGIRGFFESLFMPHSHDSADSVDTALEASQKGIRAVKISLVALMITAIAQLGIVVLTSSVALLADTIHNFSDALTAVPLWIAFVLGRRAATSRFTYGYGRAEDLAGLFIVGMITFSAILAGWESIDRLLNPQPLQNIPILIAAGVIGFLGNELVALYRIRVGHEIGSAALVADGYHARTDGFTSLAVVFGAIGVALGFPQADPLVGLLITVMILFVLKGAVVQVFSRLMDAVEPVHTARLEEAARSQPGVIEVSSARLRWLGHRMEAEVHITVDCDMSTLHSHNIAEAVRHAVFHDVPKVADVVVHVDPCTHRVTQPHKTTIQHLPRSPRNLGSKEMDGQTA